MCDPNSLSIARNSEYFGDAHKYTLACNACENKPYPGQPVLYNLNNRCLTGATG